MRIPYGTMKETFRSILLKHGFGDEEAEIASSIFADNSLDGVYTHGLNRFPKIIEDTDKGLINPSARAETVFRAGAFERWNGHRGFGPVNAALAIDRAMELASEHAVGIVALGNNNHWLRGGTYGLRAAGKGYASICWTNTIANLPPWGGRDPKLGNNPLVISVPRRNGVHFVLDIAMSQFSYGKLELYRLNGKKLPFPGGYDEDGKLTDDPAAIEKTRRGLPIGYHKGSGLSLALDLLGSMLALGNTVGDITSSGAESGVTQIMMAFDPRMTGSMDDEDSIISRIIDFTQSSAPVEEDGKVLYPGEHSYKIRQDNLQNGIPVIDEVWERVQSL